MSQKPLLIETLKQTLKIHGKKYEDIAARLNLSIGTIKRLFSKQDFDLDRLEDICGMMDMELSDLFQIKSRNQFKAINDREFANYTVADGRNPSKE